MHLNKTPHTVTIEGNQVAVMQDGATSRFYATVDDGDHVYRNWHAMNLELLQIRIDKTTKEKQ